MNNFMSNVFKSSILGSISMAILGILLIFYSAQTIITISYVTGAILIAIGVIALLKFINDYKSNIRNELDIVYGIVSVILGIIVISKPEGIASIIPFVVAVFIIISSATKFQYSLELKKQDNELWKSTMIISIVTMLCGILLIFNPFKGAVMFIRIVGILILVYALLDLTSTIAIRNSVKKLQNAIEEVVEAEIVEDKKEEAKKLDKPKKKTSKKKGK